MKIKKEICIWIQTQLVYFLKTPHSSSQDNICGHEVCIAIHTSARASTICRARIEIKIAMKIFYKYL